MEASLAKEGNAGSAVEGVSQSQREQKSASQHEIVAEKMVSGKDGTVTEAPMQDYANSSIKGSGTKYDESSSRM